MSLSGSADIQGALVVGTLSLSGNSDPSSGGPGGIPASLLELSPLATAVADLEAALNAAVPQSAHSLPDVATISPNLPGPDGGPSAFTQPSSLKVALTGTRQRITLLAVDLGDTSQVALAEAVDSLFADLEDAFALTGL